jgi:hypothetical protein
METSTIPDGLHGRRRCTTAQGPGPRLAWFPHAFSLQLGAFARLPPAYDVSVPDTLGAPLQLDIPPEGPPTADGRSPCEAMPTLVIWGAHHTPEDSLCPSLRTPSLSPTDLEKRPTLLLPADQPVGTGTCKSSRDTTTSCAKDSSLPLLQPRIIAHPCDVSRMLGAVHCLIAYSYLQVGTTSDTFLHATNGTHRGQTTLLYLATSKNMS